jgi:hypothetical protein
MANSTPKFAHPGRSIGVPLMAEERSQLSEDIFFLATGRGEGHFVE